MGLCPAEGTLGSRAGGKECEGNRAWEGGATSRPEAAPRAGQDLLRGPQSQDPGVPLGPAGASAPPQGLQLVGHLLQLCLDGRQALQFLVLGENIKGHTGTDPGSRAALDMYLCFSEPRGLCGPWGQ